MTTSTVEAGTLRYFAQPSPTSLIAVPERVLAGLPATPEASIRWTRNVVLHVVDVVAFGVDVDDTRLDESEIRSAQGILEQALVLQDDPLSVMRDPEQRVIGVCQHLALLAAALLRHAGVPARVRYGFVPYIHRGKLEDHCIVEAWTDDRWRRFDPGQGFPVGHPVLDNFVPAGEAWLRCAAGDDDPERYGAEDLFQSRSYRGAFYLRNSVVRDLASLAKVDLHPNDWWGLMLGQEEDGVDEVVDEAARLTLDDGHHEERIQRFAADARLNPSGGVMYMDARRSDLRAVALPEQWFSPWGRPDQEG
jgi:hypothetical protein